MAFWINAKDSFSILEKEGGRMPQVLPSFAIHDDLALGFRIKIDPGELAVLRRCGSGER